MKRFMKKLVIITMLLLSFSVLLLTSCAGNVSSEKENKTPNLHIAAEFSANPTTGICPATISFTDLSVDNAGAITFWSWDFDNDGVTDSTLQNPDYTYNNSGTYSVKLTVTGPSGSSTTTKENYIVIEEDNSEPGSGGAGGEIGLTNNTITVSSVQRSYQLHVPNSYEQSVPIPVLVFLHGLGGTSADGIYLWSEDADSNNFIVASPQALRINGYAQWNFSNMSDINFINAMLDDIESKYNAAIKREYSVGFSNGAFFSLLLGLFIPARLAACCSHSGGYADGMPTSAARNIPIFLIHGDADTAVYVSRSDTAYSLYTQAGHEVRYDRLQGVGHTYVRSKNPEIWAWFSEHPLP
ncbi:MAG: PKD domain-containing protein [Planctomycetota bacterium]